MAAKRDLRSSAGRSHVRYLRSRPWHRVSAQYQVWSRNVPGSEYAGEKGGNGCNSGADSTVNEQLCFFAQVLLLISS